MCIRDSNAGSLCDCVRTCVLVLYGFLDLVSDPFIRFDVVHVNNYKGLKVVVQVDAM